MSKGGRHIRIQDGALVSVSRAAARELGARSGTWLVEDAPADVLLLRSQEGAFADATLRLAGQIRVTGALCDVVALIGQSGWTGSMVVNDDGGSRTIEFESGRVSGASSTVRLERFADIVYRFGLATRKQLDDARHAAAITGTSLAESLAESDFVTEGDLETVQRRYVEEIFYAMVRVSSGAFYFFDKRILGYELQRPHPSAFELLMEGARRMDEMILYRQRVPSEKHVPEPTSKPRTGDSVLDDVAATCNGKRSVEEVGRRLGMLEYEITQRLAALVERGRIVMRAPRPRGPEQITDIFNLALSEIHRTCDRAGVAEELRDGLTRFIGGSPVMASLISGAGPMDDGTFAPERVARNLLSRPSSEPVSRLVKAFHDYVGFGLFLATSLVSRDEAVRVKDSVERALKPLERVSHSIAPPSVAPPRRGTYEPGGAASGEFAIAQPHLPTIVTDEIETPPSSRNAGGRARRSK